MNEHPDSIEGFQTQLNSAVSSQQSLAIVGAQSKIRTTGDDALRILSTVNYAGIVEHQANDFTVTVRSGTPIQDLIQHLNSADQFLPFDPMFVDQGATVGGTIAAGFNGPCRMRYGGLRDFVIGCQFLDGKGQVVRAGGKVVKNAAGFDLPKFLVGSAGRFGLILEATFKVFPKRILYQTAIFKSRPIEEAVKLVEELIAQDIEFDALDIDSTNQVLARWSANSESTLGEESDTIRNNTGRTLDTFAGNDEHQYWRDIFDLPSTRTTLVKVPINRNRIIQFDQQLLRLEVKRRYSVAGNLALLFLDSNETLHTVNQLLQDVGLAGQVVVGNRSPNLIGACHQLRFLDKIKAALDPEKVFGAMDGVFSGERS